MKKKILATSWHPGGINAILPVIRRLKIENKLDLSIIGYGYSEKILKNTEITYKTIKDVSKQSMDRLIQEETPDLVLTGTSIPDSANNETIEQAITIVAKNQKIPTISILDFWGNYSKRFSNIFTNEKFKYLPDKLAIMDIYAEKDMLEEGFDKNILIITGNPHFDNLENKARKFTETEKQNIRQQIGLNSDLLLFYAANAWKKEKDSFGYWDLDNICLINEVLYELQNKNKVSLIVKLHPRSPLEDSEEISHYIDKFSAGQIILVKDINPQELVLASNLTMTPFSTIAIEATYMKKPCISLQPGLKGQDYLSILTKNKIIPAGYTEENCKTLIKKAITDNNYREKELTEKASTFRTDGKATERVTNLIYEMLGLNI